MLNFFQKLREFINRPTHSRTTGIIMIFILISTICLTVIVAQQKQITIQNAVNLCESNFGGTCVSSCNGVTCGIGNCLNGGTPINAGYPLCSNGYTCCTSGSTPSQGSSPSQGSTPNQDSSPSQGSVTNQGSAVEDPSPHTGGCWLGDANSSQACDVGGFDDNCNAKSGYLAGITGNECCAKLGYKYCSSMKVTSCGLFVVTPYIECYGYNIPVYPTSTPRPPNATPITTVTCTADNVGQDCLKPDGAPGSCATDATPYNYCSGSTGCYINGDGSCTDSTNGISHTYNGWCANANVVSYFECNRNGGACTYKEKTCGGGTSCTTASGNADCALPTVPTTYATPTIYATPTKYVAPTTRVQPTSYIYPTSVLTPTPSNITLVSALNIQDASSPDSFTANLILYDLTTNNVVTGAPATQTFTSTSIPDRQYSVNITLTNLAQGKYFIIIRKDNMIAKAVFTVSGSGTTVTVPTTTLVFGDLNEDNRIDIVDYNIFKSCWKQSAVDSCTLSDFDQNGGAINEVDYNTWVRGLATWEKEGQGL